MKRLFSFMMAMVLVLSLGITAFATDTGNETANDGTITITNATIGDTYKLYKIFDASYSVDSEGEKAISYSLDMPTETSDETSKHIFKTLFGVDGKALNTYFTYNTETGEVRSNGTIDKAALSQYLNSVVNNQDALRVVKATSDEVTFGELAYGYYVIDKEGDNDATVTITSAAPTIEVIDKNQLPGNDFNKLVYDEDLKTWERNSSANIGDIVDFKVQFQATNYNGDKQVKYYTVGDKKGDALWVEFNSVEVYVNGVKLDRGYYWGLDGTSKTGEWEFFGTWTDAEKSDPDNAQWIMIHRGFDEFDVVIPWMSNYHFVGSGNGFSLTFDKNPEATATSIYSSPVDVKITYKASVEPGAKLDGESNLFNQAELFWTDETTKTHPEKPKTDMTVHALGITKFDGDTDELLSGAVFKIYSDEACTTPVYVIPTLVEGVYILDDLNTIVSGMHRDTSREKYHDKLEAYLGPDYATKQKNEVVTQINGKLVILGLEKGTYWLKETDAPDGYNVLAAPVMVTIDGSTEDYIFETDDAGNVVENNPTKTETYKVKGQRVENNKGTELPSTGGQGTMMMITIGTMIAMAFAVLLITHKKMSIYED